MSAKEPEEPGRRLLDFYLRFVLRDETRPLRERLQRGLVERALKTGRADHVMTVSTISERIERVTGLVTYPDELILQGLESLMSSGDVSSPGTSQRGDSLYRLSDSRYAAIDRLFEQADSQAAQFQKSLVEAFSNRHGSFSEDDATYLIEAFNLLVSRVLGALGDHCAQKLVEERRFAEPLAYPNYRADLEASLAALPQALRDSAREVFLEILRSPSEEQAVYLYSAGQTYYMVSILNLDPELQALHRLRFEDTTVFLDTNILVAAVLDEHYDHSAIDKLLHFSERLGLGLRFPIRTETEFNELLNEADDQYRAAPPLSDETASKFALAINNPFLESWLVSYQNHRVSWNQYGIRLRSWQTYLAEKYGVGREDVFPVIESGPDYSRVYADLDRGIKRRMAVAHDTQVLLGVMELITSDESAGHPFGHRFWLVTRDRNVASCGEKILARGGLSPAMLAEEWLQYIAPFVAPETSDQDLADIFARLLSSRFFVSLGTRLDLKDLQPFTDPDIASLVEGLSVEEASDLVAAAHQQVATTQVLADRRREAELERFTTLLEEKLEAKKARGELVAADAAEREIARVRRQAALATETSTEKDERIRELEESLDTARRHERTSATYLFERCKRVALPIIEANLRSKRRLVGLGLVMILAILGYQRGWLNEYVAIAGAAALVLGFLTIDVGVAKKRIKRISGPGAE